MDDDPLHGFNFSSDEESTAKKQERKVKLNQSEAAFQAEVKLWRPVCQAKQAARRLQFSTDPTAPPPSRSEALEIKAAAEERYYSRDFGKSLALAGRALLAGDKLQPAETKELLFLQGRCRVRLDN